MIPVYAQQFFEEDAQAAADVVRSGILSAFGDEVKKLEAEFARLVGSKYAISCSSGTTGLYLALLPYVGKDDIVAVPTCSYAATAFAVQHHQGKVMFVDCDPNTWNIDLDALERAVKHATLINRPIAAVLAVHNYGNPIDMDRLMSLSRQWGFVVVEDACEAFTGTYDGRQLGSIGHVGVYSFYGNKLVASGEGGMVVTNDEIAANRMKLERGQGQDPNRRFHHLVPGWNFRFTNLQAAIVNSQLKRLDNTVARKNEIYERYRDHLDGDLVWQQTPNKGQHCWWMISVRHWEQGWYKMASAYLEAHGVETRPIFPPIHLMPASHIDLPVDSPFRKYSLPNAEFLTDTGITLPSGPALTNDQIDTVCALVNKITH